MEVLKTYIMHQYNQWQMMFYCGEGNYYITSTGAFGQRDMRLKVIPPTEAEALIDKEDEQ